MDVHICCGKQSKDAQCTGMGGTFPATARFQDSDLEGTKDGVQMHFGCDFSPFRIQTLTSSHLCTGSDVIRIGHQSYFDSSTLCHECIEPFSLLRACKVCRL